MTSREIQEAKELMKWALANRKAIAAPLQQLEEATPRATAPKLRRGKHFRPINLTVLAMEEERQLRGFR